MRATGRELGGGVLGFAIAFIAFAFGGALGLPESVRLLVIGVGVLLAVLSAGMRGLGLAALVLGGIVLVSSISLLGALGAASDLDEVPPVVSRTGTTPPPQADVRYMLTPRDKQWIEASWGRKPEALRQYACASIRDGISDAELQAAASQLEGIPRSGPAKTFPQRRPRFSPSCERPGHIPRPNSAKEAGGASALPLGLPQHADEHRPERPVLLAVDQEFGKGQGLRPVVMT
jgi:hypothetical protein